MLDFIYMHKPKLVCKGVRFAGILKEMPAIWNFWVDCTEFRFNETHFNW